MLGFESTDAFKAYVTCIMLGIALLFAYNALLSTPAYFSDYYKFAENDENAVPSNPDFWDNVVSMISLVANVPNLFVQGLLLHSASRKIKQHHKLLVGLTLMAIALLLIPLVGVFKVGESGAMAYLMSAIVLCAMGTGLYQSTAMAVVAGFPSHFVAGFIVSISVSGVLTNVIGIVTQASMPDTHQGHDDQSKVFYGVSGAIIIVTIIALGFFKYNPYARQHVPEYRDEAAALAEREREKAGLLSAAEEGAIVGADGEAKRTASAIDVINRPAGENESNTSMVTDKDSIVASPSQQQDAQAMFADVSALSVFKLTWNMQISVLITFIITLFVMPALAVAVDPKHKWYPILVITTFNVADTVGRSIPNIRRTWCPRRWVLPLACVRVLFIGLWFLAYKTEVITGHAYPIVLMALTGATSGYVACMAMIYAPQTEGLDNEARKNVSGNILSFMLLSGCSIGATLGWIVTFFSD